MVPSLAMKPDGPDPDVPRAVARSGDGELIAAVRSGDTEACDILYRRHREAARALALHLIPVPAEADDVVADAFARAFEMIARGGPAESFRPYVLMATQRAADERLRAQDPDDTTDEMDVPGLGKSLASGGSARPGESLTARALRSLPERWRAVLWQGALEEATPVQITELLGSTQSGAAALSHRALDGLRAAYLRMYLGELTRPECRPAAGKLGDHARRALSRRDTRLVSRHLGGCAPCRAIHADLVRMDAVLRGVIAPLILDGGTGAYLAAAPPATPAPAAPRALQLRPARRGLRRAAAAAGIALALVAVAALATVLTVNSRPARRPGHLAAAGPPSPATLAPPSGRPGSAGPGPSSVSTRLARPGRKRSPAPSRPHRPDASPTASQSPSPSSSLSSSPAPAPVTPQSSPTSPPSSSPSPRTCLFIFLC
jgi:DNA-directed RNA polymerase specialized sigma24 family protein